AVAPEGTHTLGSQSAPPPAGAAGSHCSSGRSTTPLPHGRFGVAVTVGVGVMVGGAGFSCDGTHSSRMRTASRRPGPNWLFTKSPVRAENFGCVMSFAL